MLEVADQVAPLKVATLPLRSPARQKRLAVHERVWRVPAPSMLAGAVQEVPLKVYWCRAASMATENEVVGQETASMDAVHPGLSAVALDQALPLNVNAFPSWSTATQKVAVGQDTNPWPGWGPKPGQLSTYPDGPLMLPFHVLA